MFALCLCKQEGSGEEDSIFGGYSMHFSLSFDNGRSPHGYINQRLQTQFRAPDDERCSARNMSSLNELWNNKFYYKAAS